jgi:predicted MFS family arabinose efflux permease
MDRIRSGYKYYVLAVLLFGFALNSFDRSILSLLLEPIRLEFGASDTQLGLLTGLAFAVLYATLAIPIATLADRWHRRNVILLSALLWTAMTALCGLAGSFTMLLFARMGVGMGEAGAGPASHALLTTLFPQQRRATALAVFALGAPVGTMLAGLIGGWGGEHLGWRHTMLLAAAPGLLLVPLLLLTVPEPPRVSAQEDKAAPAFGQALWSLWSQPAFRHLCIACGLHSAAMYGAYNFNPSYLARSHGWSGIDTGHLVAISGFTGLAGTFAGGALADFLRARRGEQRWQLWVPGVAMLALIPVQLLCYLGGGAAMVAALLLSSMLSLTFLGPAYATAQALAMPRTRAVAAATVLLFKGVVGLGFGPLLVGAASDLLAPVAQEQSLRLGLLLVPLFNLWAGVHFFLAARHLHRSRQAAATQADIAARVARATR